MASDREIWIDFMRRKTMISTIVCCIGIAAILFSMGVLVGFKIVDRIEYEEWRH